MNVRGSTQVTLLILLLDLISTQYISVSVILVSRGREALGAQPILDTQMLIFYCIPGRSKSQQGEQIFVFTFISKNFSSFTIFFRTNSDVNLKSGQKMTGNRGMATETYKEKFYFKILNESICN